MTAAPMLYLHPVFANYARHTESSMRRLLVALVALIAGLGSASTPAVAQYKPEFKNSLVVGPSGPWGEGAAKFADLLEERTQGRINVKNYFAGQLFAGKQTNEYVPGLSLWLPNALGVR
jgi:TRAP-type C4-dicarboxylate transport system substrate-binding protein